MRTGHNGTPLGIRGWCSYAAAQIGHRGSYAAVLRTGRADVFKGCSDIILREDVAVYVSFLTHLRLP